VLDAIRRAIEWIADDSGPFIFSIFPLLLVGLAAIWMLWLIIGYLRVSQVGIEADSAPVPALPLPRAADGAIEAPRGVPYCPVDGLQYPRGARFCSQDESDLLVRCANCATTIRAADESCYRCGTRDTMLSSAAEE
jgi:hypothetical protein